MKSASLSNFDRWLIGAFLFGVFLLGFHPGAPAAQPSYRLIRATMKCVPEPQDKEPRESSRWPIYICTVEEQPGKAP